jgi:flagellin
MGDVPHQHKRLDVRLARLSSGLRINAAKDDPAGLIASENLRTDMAGISQAIDNATRASNVIATAEGALNEVSALLVGIKKLIVGAANVGGLSDEEIRANQLQIDSAVESITRVAQTTEFEGIKLLNGNLDFTVSGVSASDITDYQVQAVRFGAASSFPVAVEVLQSANQASLKFSAAGIGGSTVTIEVAGVKGSEVFSFAASTAISAIAFAVNKASDITGVSATVSGTAGMYFTSQDYGSKAFVSVQAISGTFDVQNDVGTVTRDSGQDATVVVNGNQTQGDGLEVLLRSTSLSLNLTLDSDFATTVGNTTSFSITGGGALFQLGGDVNTNQQATVGIQSVAGQRLGKGGVGYLSDIVTGGAYSLLADQTAQADDIVEEAIKDVTNLRGRLGAFQLNTLDTTVNSLQVALENVTASESAIRDADFAAETAKLTRAQILQQANTRILALANSQPQSVLNLLG